MKTNELHEAYILGETRHAQENILKDSDEALFFGPLLLGRELLACVSTSNAQ